VPSAYSPARDAAAGTEAAAAAAAAAVREEPPTLLLEKEEVAALKAYAGESLLESLSLLTRSAFLAVSLGVETPLSRKGGDFGKKGSSTSPPAKAKTEEKWGWLAPLLFTALAVDIHPDVVDPNGSMSGGSNNKKKVRLSDFSGDAALGTQQQPPSSLELSKLEQKNSTSAPSSTSASPSAYSDNYCESRMAGDRVRERSSVAMPFVVRRSKETVRRRTSFSLITARGRTNGLLAVRRQTCIFICVVN
jgi:hypothetical protein